MAIKKFFKVKYGFGVSDQVSISENELDKAIYAQREKVVVQLGNAAISGSHIISITPHYHKYTGWNEWYEPKDGEDWKQIQRDCPNFDGIIEEHKDYVMELMQGNNLRAIGKRDWESEDRKEITDGNQTNPFDSELKSLSDILKKI